MIVLSSRLGLRGRSRADPRSILPGENQAHGLGINPVLFGQNARRKRFVSIVVTHRNNGLRQNRPGIQVFVDHVHGAAAQISPQQSSACFCASGPGNDGSSDG